jgi:hypothetical protein
MMGINTERENSIEIDEKSTERMRTEARGRGFQIFHIT